MSEELKNEVMETTKDEFDEIDAFDYSDDGGSGKAIGLTVGLITGAVALGVAAYKKIKSKKKDDKPKKRVKKRLRWVEVEDDVDENDIVDSTAEEIDEEEAAKK